MLYELVLTTEPADNLVRLRLLDADGIQLAAQVVRLAQHGAAVWEGLFDTRRYVERYAGNVRLDDQQAPATAAQLLARSCWPQRLPACRGKWRAWRRPSRP
jgi:hypothetical protein